MPARINMIVTTIIISSRENPAAKKRRRADGVQPRKFRKRKPVMWKDFMRALPV
jgi:hypothetical protein